MTLPFEKLLIANRGEIALRVMRACREMGIAPVAVYSEADRDAPHVRYAAEAYPIGPGPAAESYLVGERIVEAARKAGAGAIHPGYGFLAENAGFARQCEEAGIVFVGPPPEALDLSGSKTASRASAARAGVSPVPGTQGALASDEEAQAAADGIGYPVMVKAAMGGGGKGMRLVATSAELPSSLRAARSEAKASFGDDTLYIEKAIVSPRHVEVQILADASGETIWLGERECSVQRRHQKVVEEAPSPVVDEKLRRELGEAAVAVAKAAGYRNAGTVEFLLDESGRFYFLEVNARLQVEHPVTEMVTGLDLVRAQLLLAAGGPLPLRQEDVTIRGHSIECRIYAEDPERGFVPCPGRIRGLRLPGGPGVRNESGVEQGGEVPVHYDPLMSKLVVWAQDRETAMARMRRALQEYVVLGIRTNLEFHRRVFADGAFQRGEADTGLAERILAERTETPEDVRELAALAAELHRRASGERLAPGRRRRGTWRRGGREEGVDRDPGWRRG
jgi:acetyl-CoA carboxylase biotin carboxylase subunit